MSEARLTEAQKRHLGELGALAQEGDGEACWRPRGRGEWMCARALADKGLLRQESAYFDGAFSLTEAGRKALDES